jgi:hypothetical protein
MELTTDFGTCPREGTEAITVVVTTTGGPWDGVIVITATLLLAAGLLLMICVVVVFARPSGRRGRRYGLRSRVWTILRLGVG